MDAKFHNQFNKIKLLNDIANQIGYYGVQQGNQTFIDYIDMNCGGIPDGEFNQVIDPSASFEFLSLYTQIAENRFAFACTGLLKMNMEYKKILLQFLNQVGKDMKIEGDISIEQAFEIVQSFVLDGMPGENTKQIIEKTDEKIVWEKIKDSHKNAWEKAEGDLDFYYQLQQQFVQGLLNNCGFTFKIDSKKIFSLSIK